MASEVHAAWDAAFLKWQTARAAVDTAPADLPDKEDDHLLAVDCEAWCALLALPAPDWSAAAWKVRQLLDPGTNNQTSGWDGDLVRPLFADLDRLLPTPGPLQRQGRGIDRLIARAAKSQNGTTREDHSHAAPDQHKSEEIIVADTANSIDAPAMEAKAASVIVRLAQVRDAASQKADAYVADGGNHSMDHGHWHRLWRALTNAIVCHVPTSLSDVLLVLEGVSSIRDLIENTDCTDQERRDCSEATTIAIVNCLPVVSDHVSDVARVLSGGGVKVARRRIEIREGRYHG